MPMGLSGPIYLGFSVVMLAGAWLDFTRRKLPNILCLLVALAGIAATTLLAGPGALGSSAIHMIIALAIGILLFRLGMIGGGDAKFYAATALWFGLPEALRLLLSVAITGFILLVLFIIFRNIMKNSKESGKSKGDFVKVPFGIAIAIGAILAKSQLY